MQRPYPSGCFCAREKRRPSIYKALASPRITVFLLLGLSLLLHLGWLAQPNEVVFDEVHFGRYVNGYLTGEYIFCDHPPLGNLLIAGALRLGGVIHIYDFRRIGIPYSDHNFVWLRLLPALFGSLLAPLVYLLALRASGSRMAATISGVFVLFENALLVQTKFILLDAFLLVFGFASLYLFLQSRNFFVDGRWGGWAVIGTAVSAGLCIATKWTGIAFWGLLLTFGAYSIFRQMWTGDEERRNSLLCHIAFLAVPSLVYVAVFFIHFELLWKPGSGNRFMTARLQASQATGYPLPDFPLNLWELNGAMYASHAQTTADHPYGSRWYTWPLMRQPIFYWYKNIPSLRREGLSPRIYLLGNPVVWWTSALLTAVFLLECVRRIGLQSSQRFFGRGRQEAAQSGASAVNSTDVLLAAGYLATLLPFAAIGRVTFLYHYAASLIFSIVIVSVMFVRLPRYRKTVFAALLALTLLGFFTVWPLTVGVSFTDWPLEGGSQLLSLLLNRWRG